MAKDVGAKKVIVASCAPPIRYPNVYGIDMPSRKELVAYGKDEDQIASAIGADLVVFQTLPDLVESVRHLNQAITTFDCSVFTGEYVTGGVDEEYLQQIEDLRADNNRNKALKLQVGDLDKPDREEMSTKASTPTNGADDTVGLYNSFSS